jgi:7-cyano-7-deazaguanine reductase
VSLELGKKSEYIATYCADKLFPIPRQEKRVELGINPNQLPFWGFDAWNHYEVSWLNSKGKPMVAMAEIVYDCQSPNIIESKSLKLYFNSLNNTHFKSISELESIIKCDLSRSVGAEVYVCLKQLGFESSIPIQEAFAGETIDNLDIACSVYSVNPDFLTIEEEMVTEVLYSDLLKSNCLVTFQPDWGSIQIQYSGPKINREGLLKYIVSFRNHNEFHEQCVERIFMDIMQQCNPLALTVYGRYTRRGGLDINPYRSTSKSAAFSSNKIRLPRQ